MKCRLSCANRGKDVVPCSENSQKYLGLVLNVTNSEIAEVGDEGPFPKRDSNKAGAEDASVFAIVEQAPPTEENLIGRTFTKDVFREKIILTGGYYLTDEGVPWVLPVVRKVEQRLASDYTLNKNYLPVLGMPAFGAAATALLLGHESPVIISGNVVAIQTVSEAGALRLAAEFLASVMHYDTVYVSKETWEGYKILFPNSGFSNYRSYRYWDPSTKGLNFKGLIEDLRGAPEKSVVILQTSAHNPTGADPTREQWVQIGKVLRARKLFPIFDSAFQGLISGDPDADAWVIRYFVNQNFEFFCCQSFSKNFGLYSERVGNLLVVGSCRDALLRTVSQLALLIQGMYCSPPSHGGLIVTRILRDPELYAEWRGCLKVMATRMKEMRQGLKDRIVNAATPGNWDHLTNQVGIFSYTGLSHDQVTYLEAQYHIYIHPSGRINICALNSHNLDYVAHAINDAVSNIC